MLSLAIETPARHVPSFMTNDDDSVELRLLGRALANLRMRARLSQAAAGEAFGSSGQGWAKYENGKAPTLFRPQVQAKLAAAIGAKPDDLNQEVRRIKSEVSPLLAAPLAAPSAAPIDEQSMLEIRDRVQAGAWLMADDFSQTSFGRYPVAKDPRYPYARQWLSEVTGDSVNLLGIVERDLVHVVDLVGSGTWPKNGDIVEVERVRFGGQERELTLKQLEVTPAGNLLWPRSSNPRWSKPLDLREGADHDDSIEVHIRGIVLASIRRF